VNNVETVRDHYNSFLGSVYSWIIGDFDTAYQKNVELFADLNISATPGALAIDLGCGPGCQSLPLAELGFNVLAIDFCQELLDELHTHANTSDIERVCDDILNFQDHIEQSPDLIVCMGDTLVHLPDQQSVSTLIDRVCESLRPGGQFIYAIRDYIGFVPGGAERFIPIRADDKQIFTCFLDYKDDVVHVHDVLHRKEDGSWKMTISDYTKLRLDTADLDRQIQDAGLVIRHRTEVDGMITVVADKP
jgi:SAM-dependent methyltransferase